MTDHVIPFNATIAKEYGDYLPAMLVHYILFQMAERPEDLLFIDNIPYTKLSGEIITNNFHKKRVQTVREALKVLCADTLLQEINYKKSNYYTINTDNELILQAYQATKLLTKLGVKSTKDPENYQQFFYPKKEYAEKYGMPQAIVVDRLLFLLASESLLRGKSQYYPKYKNILWKTTVRKFTDEFSGFDAHKAIRRFTGNHFFHAEGNLYGINFIELKKDKNYIDNRYLKTLESNTVSENFKTGKIQNLCQIAPMFVPNSTDLVPNSTDPIPLYKRREFFLEKTVRRRSKSSHKKNKKNFLKNSILQEKKKGKILKNLQERKYKKFSTCLKSLNSKNFKKFSKDKKIQKIKNTKIFENKKIQLPEFLHLEFLNTILETESTIPSLEKKRKFVSQLFDLHHPAVRVMILQSVFDSLSGAGELPVRPAHYVIGAVYNILTGDSFFAPHSRITTTERFRKYASRFVEDSVVGYFTSVRVYDVSDIYLASMQASRIRGKVFVVSPLRCAVDSSTLVSHIAHVSFETELLESILDDYIEFYSPKL